MKRSERWGWILERIRVEPAGGGVDVLHAEFVEDYIYATGAPFQALAYGAFRCRQLGRDLSEMYGAGMLVRSVSGLGHGARGESFPSWVYHYRIPTDSVQR